MPTLVYSLRRLYRRLSRVLEQRLVSYDLTLPQWHFLTEIANDEGLSQRELTDRVGVAASTTVSALRVLERRGFVRREGDADDARSLKVFITPAGRALRKGVRPILEEVDKLAENGLTQTEIRQFRLILERLNLNLEGPDEDGARQPVSRSKTG